MNRLLPLIALCAGLALGAVQGCIFSPKKDKPRIDTGEYKALTSPENVVNNLQVAYRRQEIEKYAELLDPEFIFKFQSTDVPPGLERDYWNRDEDSTGTYALFTTPLVSAIRIDLTFRASEDANRPEFPGARRIRINPTKLDVDQVDGITLVVDGDIQDMYFRKGSAEAGTDSTRWYLFEWYDQPGGNAPGIGITPLAAAGDSPPGETRRVSWGEILGALSRRQ